jgi:hypothetical protein
MLIEILENLEQYESLTVLRGVVELVIDRDQAYLDMSNTLSSCLSQSAELVRSKQVEPDKLIAHIEAVAASFRNAITGIEEIKAIDETILRAVETKLKMVRN